MTEEGGQRVALITGSARGLGRAIAQALAGQGVALTRRGDSRHISDIPSRSEIVYSPIFGMNVTPGRPSKCASQVRRSAPCSNAVA